MRVNLSVAIVYMAGSNKTGDSLGLEGDTTFGWSDKQQVASHWFKKVASDWSIGIM